MIDGEALAEVPDGEDGEDGEGDDFLDGFEFGGGVVGAADAVGRDGEAVFKKGDAPTDEDDDPEGAAGEFEVAVPREGHEDVRQEEEQDGEISWREHGGNVFRIMHK